MILWRWVVLYKRQSLYRDCNPTINIHCFAIIMHLPTIRFTVPINTTLPHEYVIVPQVPYLDLNTDKRNKRMTTIPFNLHQPMLIYATEVCTSAKILSETVVVLCFSWCSKNLFFDIIKQVGTCPRNNNNNIVYWSLYILCHRCLIFHQNRA